MKIIAALIASVALVGISTPASASRTVEMGESQKFLCNIFKVDGPQENWIKVGKNIWLLRYKTGVTVGGALRLTFLGDKVENIPNGQTNLAFYKSNSGLEFMMVEKFDNTKPTGKKLSYSFIVDDKTSGIRGYATCQMTYN